MSFNPHDTSRGEAQARLDELCDLTRQAQELEQLNAKRDEEIKKLSGELHAVLDSLARHMGNITQDRERLLLALQALLARANQNATIAGWGPQFEASPEVIEARAAVALSLDLGGQGTTPRTVCRCGNPNAKERAGGPIGAPKIVCCDQCWAIACAIQFLETPLFLDAPTIHGAEALRYLQVGATFRLSRG